MSWNDLKDKQTVSLESTTKLLRAVIAHPSKYASEPTITNALASQSSIAKLSLDIEIDGDSLNIISMSLNTFKTRCEERIPGGFAAVDHLRRSALRAVEIENNKPAPKNSRTREALTEKITELSASLEALKRSNLILLQTLSEVRFEIDSVLDAPDDLSRKNRASKLVKRITAITSLNPENYQIPPLTSASISIIQPKRKGDENG
ncbi:hypothetical protein [Pseudomonas sp. RC10]|uniref:hypothetical protein n=1 Tax=Pseudomonas bambusae TaxID=3139142 RepID=UPI003138B440